jgi:hypothetical protein
MIAYACRHGGLTDDVFEARMFLTRQECERWIAGITVGPLESTPNFVTREHAFESEPE